MRGRTLLGTAVCVAALAAGPGGATPAPAADCEAAAPPGELLGDRAAALSAFERLPETCLKALFAGCSDAAAREVLDMGSAAVCSIGYEALLKREFGGDFKALMGWWRMERGAPAAR